MKSDDAFYKRQLESAYRRLQEAEKSKNSNRIEGAWLDIHECHAYMKHSPNRKKAAHDSLDHTPLL